MLQSNLAEYRGWEIFRQRIFKCFTMQICRLFFTAFWNFWYITQLSTINHRWVINAQTGPVFLAHPVCEELTYELTYWLNGSNMRRSGPSPNPIYKAGNTVWSHRAGGVCGTLPAWGDWKQRWATLASVPKLWEGLLTIGDLTLTFSIDSNVPLISVWYAAKILNLICWCFAAYWGLIATTGTRAESK